MAWQIPGAAQWNPGVALTPDPTALNMTGMGSLTPDQWTLMQQQNWQHWAQWQQQYAQWQTQYGDKYAEQMQGMQSMGMVPPQPKTVLPPAPPPPEKPPPPPHENDQPLYSVPQPPPANPPTKQPIPFNPNACKNTVNMNSDKQKWSYNVDYKHEGQLPYANPVNNEALKKLAEEERLFDVQFKNWEEEIEKWKKENVNHPDKQAYSEYEQKFEACRAQLLERRKQMNQKRASLMNNASPLQNSVNANAFDGGINIPPSNLKTSYNKSNTHLNQISKQPLTYKNQSSQYNKHGDDFKDYSRSNNIALDPQDKYKLYQFSDKFSSSRMNENNLPQDQGYVNQEGIQNSSFLHTTEEPKGIPGLDLVTDVEKAPQYEVIDITDEKSDTQAITQKGPDYSTISQGINNILGDAKIMNILSMVQNQSSNVNLTPNMPVNTSAMSQDGQWNRKFVNNQDMCDNRQLGSSFDNKTQGSNYNKRLQVGNYNNTIPENNYGMRPLPPNNFGNRQQPTNNYGNRSLAPSNYENRPSGSNNYDNKPSPTGLNNYLNRPSGPNMYEDKQPPTNNYDNRTPNNFRNKPTGQNNYENRTPELNNFGNRPPNINTGQQNVDRRENNFNRPDNNMQVSVNNYQKPHPNPSQDGYDQCYIENMDRYRSDQRNMGNREEFLPRPLLEINTGLDNILTPNFDKRHAIPAPIPPKPSWSEDPLFTPSIIVEYEHKSLRLKAREFIEPVHTFDYDHKSKDEDKKKDFEKEVEELYTRKPRAEKENNRRFRELYTRDYEKDQGRIISPEDFRPRQEHFVHEDRPRSEDKSDDKRHDDRDRYRCEEYRDRERDRERDFGRDRAITERDIRSRDINRERDFGRDLGRDRDYGRERDLSRGRDPDYGREYEQPREKDVKDRIRDLERDREMCRDRIRDSERDREMCRDRETGRDKNRSRSHEKEKRKRAISIDNGSNTSKKIKTEQPRHVIMVDDLLEEPGRSMRPKKIVIILRGPPGSGKSYLAKLIRDKEAEYGGTARIMSIDDYFMQETEIEEKDPATGKVIKKPSLKYEYDEQLEESYIASLKRAFRRSITDGYFTLLIFDAVNDQLKSYADMWSFSRQHGFQVYICTMELDPQICFKRNIHNRKLEDIEVICARFFPTPLHHLVLDPTSLLQNAAITEVTMEDAVSMEDVQETEVEGSFTSKWERMDDVNQLARLDGTSKPLRPKLSMEDYLQLDEWTPNKAKPGKKTMQHG